MSATNACAAFAAAGITTTELNAEQLLRLTTAARRTPRG
jgi:hypothetical protein